MAANKDSTDVLMTFIDSSGQGVPAESNTVWDEDDTTMMADFTQGSAFELDDFALGVGLDGRLGGTRFGGLVNRSAVFLRRLLSVPEDCSGRLKNSAGAQHDDCAFQKCTTL